MHLSLSNKGPFLFAFRNRLDRGGRLEVKRLSIRRGQESGGRVDPGEDRQTGHQLGRQRHAFGSNRQGNRKVFKSALEI